MTAIEEAKNPWPMVLIPANCKLIQTDPMERGYCCPHFLLCPRNASVTEEAKEP